MLKRFWASGFIIILLLQIFTSVAVGTDSSGVLNAVTYESLTKQVKDAVTEDIALPETVDDTQIVWSSSNENIISEKGIVNRPETEDATVTLTAALGSEEKEFTFNVLAENKALICGENFYYPQYDGVDIRRLLPSWETRWNSYSYISGYLKNETLSNGEENMYLHNNMWNDRPYYPFTDIKPEGRFSVSTRVYMDFPDGEIGYYDYEFLFGENDARVRFYFSKEDKLADFRFYGGEEGSVYLGNLTYLNSLQLKRNWLDFKWTFDTDEHKMWFFVNGTLINPSGTDAPFASVPLDRVHFEIGNNTPEHKLGIDDFCVVNEYETADDVAVYEAASLIEEECVSKQSKYAITENLDLSLTSIKDLYGVDVSFESSDGAISENGEVVRNAEDKNVVLTATVSKNGAENVIKKELYFTVKSSGYDIYSSESFYYPENVGERVTSENGGWKLSAVPKYEGFLDAEFTREGENQMIKVHRETADSDLGETDSRNFGFDFTENVSAHDVSVEGRIKLEMPLESGETQLYVIRPYGKREDASSSQEMAEIQLRCSTTSCTMRISGKNTSRELSGNLASPGEWVKFKFEFDLFHETINVYINDELVTYTPVLFRKDDESYGRCEKLTHITMHPFRTTRNAAIYIDDIAVYGKNGVISDAEIYKNGTKIDDIGYIEKGDSISAFAKLYNYDKDLIFSSGAVVAASYSGKWLEDVRIVNSAAEDGKTIKASFSQINIPDDVKDLSIKFYFLDGNGNLSPLKIQHEYPSVLNGNITPYEITDEKTGRTYYAIDLNGEDALRSYYTMTTFTKDNKFYFYDRQYQLYEYDIATGNYCYVDKLYNQNLVMVSKKGGLFYVKYDGSIIRMNTESHEKLQVGELYENITSAQLMQVNDDETYLSIEASETAPQDIDTTKEKRIPVMNIETGEWDLSHHYGFDTPYYVPDHMNLNPNPEYSSLVSFAHEGNGENGGGNPDRIWLLDRENGTYVNVFKQKMKTDTMPAETVSHEAWMQSGEQIMFANSSNTTPGGITLFNKDGSDRRYVNNDYNYLHPSGSTVNDRFVISDTGYNGKTSELVLIDCYTGKSYHLATLAQNGKDPGHVHPSFSRDGNSVIFGLYSEDLSTIRVGWMDISDIIQNAADGESIALSEECGTTSYEGTDFYLKKEKYNDTTVYTAEKNNHINVNIKAFEKEAADVKITLEYLDEGTNNILIDYVVWQETDGKYGIVNKQEKIERKGTASLVTAEVVLEGMNAENLKMMGADFTVKGEDSSVSVKSVSVKEAVW